MARWRLTAPHYLNVEGTTWEYKELDRGTGKQIRKTFPVPQLLEPDNPGDWTHKNGDEGYIAVTNGGTSEPRDIVFVGEPTPDMVPLDKEAEKISASFAERWKHPINSLPSNGYSGVLLDGLQSEMAKVQAGNKPAQVEGMSELLAAMTAMMKQQGELLAALSEKRRA